MNARSLRKTRKISTEAQTNENTANCHMIQNKFLNWFNPKVNSVKNVVYLSKILLF